MSAVTPDQPAIDAIKARIAAGDLAAARTACEQFLAGTTDAVRQSPVRAWLGVVEQRSGALPAAVAQYELALQADPANARLTVQLGLAHFQLGNGDRAEALYREALRLQPVFPLALYNLGVLLSERRDWDGAKRAFEGALGQQPQFPEALANLGNTLAKLNDLDGAARRYQQSLALNPQLAIAHRGMGLLYMRHQQHAPAIRFLEQAVRADPSMLDAWLDLADCLHNEGDDARALQCVDEVLKRDPANETARFERALYAGEQPETAPPAMLERLYDGMAGHFDEHLTGRLGYRIPTQLLEELSPWLRDFPAQHGYAPDVLDLGCGTGLFGAAVRPHAAKLTGIDLSSGMLDKARARNVYDVLEEGEILAWLEAHPAPCDLITATDVLIYFGRLDALFTQIASHLPAHGLFAFSTESPAGMTEDFRLQSEARYAHSPAYVERAATAAGLAIDRRLDVVVRTERAQPVAGHLYILRRA